MPEKLACNFQIMVPSRGARKGAEGFGKNLFLFVRQKEIFFNLCSSSTKLQRKDRFDHAYSTYLLSTFLKNGQSLASCFGTEYLMRYNAVAL
jgi:hypothetical protein